ncbi:rho GTPase-activating protein 5-like [Actinidia eriantha]|uniref:rho GTPase-activating protein 5-like n=1 Tax=Actinidia eriantha TaxID=165200 RepID=UPI00258CE1C8|nr:rho GTPase-activating protein 5-like [Actinidia eriantha]
MDNLSWKSMTTIRDDVYPDLVAHFYANATREYQDESIKSYVKGESFSLDRSVIREILGVGHGGEIYRSNVTQVKQLSVLFGQTVDECVQPTTTVLPLVLRLVHPFLNDKVDNMTTKLMFVERKMRKLTKEVRSGKRTKEEEEDEKEEDEKSEEDEEQAGKRDGEGNEKKKEDKQNQRGDGVDQEEDESDEEDSSKMESHTSPALLRTIGYKYTLRQREAKKFSNTS